MEVKKAKVIMLPTEDKSNILLHKQNRSLFYTQVPIKEDMLLDNPQHLYFTSDDEIKEGDWYIDDTDTIRKSLTSDKNYWEVRKNEVKIIATTDTKLGYFQREPKSPYFEQLPQIPQSFIEKYVKLGGIDEVNVEYEHDDTVPYPKLRLKVDSHNTITIHPIKDR